MGDEFASMINEQKKEHFPTSEASKKSYEGDMLIAMSSDAKSGCLHYSLDKLTCEKCESTISFLPIYGTF